VTLAITSNSHISHQKLASWEEVAGLSNGDGGGATKSSALMEKGRKRMSAEDYNR